MRLILQISFFLSLCLVACDNSVENLDRPPELVYQGLINSSMQQGLGTDSVDIRLTFSDLDGDLSGVNELDIFIIDNRDGSEYIVRSFPQLPNNGRVQEGTMILTLPNSCCIYPPEAMTPACDRNPRYPENRFTVDVYIEDLNRNQSNRITTDTITMNCL